MALNDVLAFGPPGEAGATWVARMLRRHLPVLAMVALAVLVVTAHAHAATTTGGGGALPWEGPLATFQQSIQGPVAYAISVMGVVVCGAILVFGGEIGEFVRRFIMLLLAIALLVLADQVLSNFFSGALVS